MTRISNFPTLNAGPASIVTLTRPNDTTQYAIGDVFGAASDARNAVSLPATLNNRYLAVVRIDGINQRSPTDAQWSGHVLLFTSQPSTTTGDNSPLQLSDADIALCQVGATAGVTGTSLSFGNSVNGASYNNAAGSTGRRGGGATIAANSASNVPGAVPASLPGYTHCYVFMSNTYVPLANEILVLTFTPYYVDRVTSGA